MQKPKKKGASEKVKAPTKDELIDMLQQSQALLARVVATADLPEETSADEEEADEEEEAPKKKKKGAKAEADEEEESSETEEEGFEMPKPKAISKMKPKELAALAAKINLPIGDDTDEDDLRGLLTTVSLIVDDEVDDLDDDDLTALCEALDITPSKKAAKNIAAIKEYFSAESEGDGEEEATDTDDADTDDDDDKKKKGDDDDEDGVDREAISKAAELPDKDTMIEQLDAYNEAADEDDEIEVEPGKVKIAYRKLLEKMVDSGEEVAEWGEPYIRNGDVCCSGLSLAEHSVKGEKGNFGKCRVTGKVFEVSDDGEATEYKPKKKK